MHLRTVTRSLGVLLPLTVLLMGGIAFASTPWTPPDDTIIKITGDKVNGFSIEHYDGSMRFPPTDSEAVAECSEYDIRVQRVRCKAEVRTWYAALGDTKRALRYARTR